MKGYPSILQTTVVPIRRVRFPDFGRHPKCGGCAIPPRNTRRRVCNPGQKCIVPQDRKSDVLSIPTHFEPKPEDSVLEQRTSTTISGCKRAICFFPANRPESAFGQLGLVVTRLFSQPFVNFTICLLFRKTFSVPNRLPCFI